MATARYKLSPGSAYNLWYHLVWCPKYRRSVLTGDIKERLIELVTEKCNELDIEVKSLEVMSDHVHLFVSAPPIWAPQEIAGRIKGYTSRILRKEFTSLRSRLPTLWSRSYYIGSAGSVTNKTIEKYIANQKTS